ncbi:hypothetical protein [Nocardioides rubriscoriae]|uniref:hypothetical protein n=1 Tax=Nocardioides rubriscoriae TaxID=642762 RepID=UPI0011DFC905|nr:hypothetical protein [Nocardioides rubriscoriae]
MRTRVTLVATSAAMALTVTAGASAARPPAAPSGEARPAAARHCAQPGPYELPHGSQAVRLRPEDFTARIDHPYWPMRPGTTWHYVEHGGGEVARVRVTVSRRTRLIEGVRARVVHDVARVGGEVVEATWDWYAQESAGSLWYLGEFSQTFEDGVPVSTEGSWVHGRDGAQAGMILPARPRPGCGYREEYRAGVAEDRARILSTHEVLRTPTGLHRGVVQTANTSPLEPDVLENKFYARGVGPVLELDLSPELGRAVLVRVTHTR